jgi:pimeloyl-ACP methyl ester carboxylesterase
MQCIVDELLVQYEQHGKGPVVLLLHGWGSQLQAYKSLSARLSRQYTVIAVDLPGMGGSQPPRTPWGLNDYASFVSHFIIKVTGSNNVFAIVGHSNGGAIAITCLAEGHFQAKKLILLASSGVRNLDSQKTRRGFLKIISKTGKLILGPLPGQTKRSVQRKFYDAIGSDALLSDQMRDTYVKIIQDDVRERANHVQASTLLIYGDNDTDTPVSLGQELARNIPVSEFVVVKDAGHYVFVDQELQVHHIIENFMQR